MHIACSNYLKVLLDADALILPFDNSSSYQVERYLTVHFMVTYSTSEPSPMPITLHLHPENYALTKIWHITNPNQDFSCCTVHPCRMTSSVAKAFSSIAWLLRIHSGNLHLIYLIFSFIALRRLSRTGRGRA